MENVQRTYAANPVLMPGSDSGFSVTKMHCSFYPKMSVIEEKQLTQHPRSRTTSRALLDDRANVPSESEGRCWSGWSLAPPSRSRALRERQRAMIGRAPVYRLSRLPAKTGQEVKNLKDKLTQNLKSSRYLLTLMPMEKVG